MLVRVSADARRLRPLEVIDEFDKYLHDELDLIREAANANQLRRNFAGSRSAAHPGDALGLVRDQRDDDGAHARHPDQPDRAHAWRPAST